MCSATRRGWRRSQRGQTTSEYVALAGVTTVIAVLMANVLGLSLRQAMESVAQRMLSVITGYP
jgi:hypothetical protein